MGCCTGRCLLITLCILQLIATVERQVFDFLGYMWAPIIANFVHIIFIIIGLFGGIQYRPKVLIIYAVWSLVWIGWNIFVICFYLEVGILQRSEEILNIGTGNKSWWLDKGIGCEVTNSTRAGDASSSEGEEYVEGCLLNYYYVEILHAGVQCILSLLGFCVSCYVIYIFTEEDDSSQPVHDELEYIKMRYRSPARSSFRDQKAYETLTTQLGSTYSSADRGLETTNYSDDSADRFTHTPGSQGKHSQPKYPDRGVVDKSAGDMPWARHSPSTRAPNMPDLGLAYDSNHPLPPPPQVIHGSYNMGQTPGITVI